MPLAFSTNQIVRKNTLSDVGYWLMLAKLTVAGVRELAYDGSTKSFAVGKTLTGDDSGARSRIIDVSTSATDAGTLTLYNIRGEYEDNEVIRDNAATVSTGTVNGALTTIADTVYRWSKDLDNTTWDSATWTRRAMEIDVVSQDARGKSQEAQVRISDLSTADTFSEYIDKCQGLIGETINIYYVHSCFLSDTSAAIAEQYEITECGKGQDMAIMSLSVPEARLISFPTRTYDNLRCPAQYKSTITCQVATDTTYSTCGHTLSECADRENVINFGGFPSIPSGEFE